MTQTMPGDAWLTMPAIAIGMLIAFLTATALARALRFSEPAGRYPGIDGLRGYAATAVYFHHAAQWLFLSQHWTVAQSRFSYNIGRIGVTLFFMTTAFLFFEKVVFSTRPVDWRRLYVGRVMRLTPMYLATIAVVLLIVASRSGWTINVPTVSLVQQLLSWATFTAFGSPPINGVANTGSILAGVYWTLPCEWFFYLSLPAIALVFRRNPPWMLTAVCTAAALTIAWANDMTRFSADIFLPFVLGAFAVYLVRRHKAAPWLRSPWIMLAALAFCCINRWERALWFSVLSCGTVFVMIVYGNTLWGALTRPAACFLGQISYSIYLIHGILISSFWTLVAREGATVALPAYQYWLWVSAGSVVLVVVSTLTFYGIERPGMRATPGAQGWFQRLNGPVS